MEAKIYMDSNRQNEPFLGTEEIKKIFDKIFKKCITLSAKAVVRMINGIFGTDYPDDSVLTYNWTEFVKDNERMNMILADCIVTVNGEHAYHMEAQTYNDNEVVFRVFDYGFEHAKRNAVKDENRYVMRFPKPVIIYLYYEYNVPDEYVLEMELDEEGNQFDYTVPVIKIPDMSSEDMEKKNMVILIPFRLMKLRSWVDKKNKKMTKSAEELKEFIECDIIGIINKNYALGNITYEDAYKLKDYSLKLRDYICEHLGVEGLEEVQTMTDHSFMTEADIICEELEILREEKEKWQRDKVELQKSNDELQSELQAYKEKYGDL